MHSTSVDYLKLACDRLDVEPGKVMAHRVYEDHIALVVDNGRLGCPKFTVPLSDLQPVKPTTLPEPVVVVVTNKEQAVTAKEAFGQEAIPVVIEQAQAETAPGPVTTANVVMTEKEQGSSNLIGDDKLELTEQPEPVTITESEANRAVVVDTLESGSATIVTDDKPEQQERPKQPRKRRR